MIGNTSSSANGRSLGYVAPVSADGVNAVPTVVNIYVDGGDSSVYSPTTAAQPNSVNFEQAPGITNASKKTFQYVPTVPYAVGKFTFDPITPPSASTSVITQVQGSSIKLPSSINNSSTTVKYIVIDPATKNPAVNSDNKNKLPIPAAPSNPGEYDWNLPPHAWSMPRVAYSDPNNIPDGLNKPVSDDRYRRGRIWWKASSSLSTVDANGKVQTGDSSDRKYGFQFLWNPTSFGTSVSVQMDATPNVNDRFLGGAGFFPATESISFNIEVNRINDFACANGLFNRPTNIGSVLGNSSSNDFITEPQVAKLLTYYNKNGSFAAGTLAQGKKTSIEKKLVDLFQRGTLADIEYLYKSINGPGPSGSSSGGDFWKNSRGIITADIGFLMPTLLNIDIGPLSYVGYVTAMNITHTMFTQDMIPTQSTVQLSFNLLATAGVATTTTGG